MNIKSNVFKYLEYPQNGDVAFVCMTKSTVSVLYFKYIKVYIRKLNINVKICGHTPIQFKILLRFIMIKEMRRKIWLFDQQKINII